MFTSEDSLQNLKYIVEDFSRDAEKFYFLFWFYGLLLDNLLLSNFEELLQIF